MNGPGNLITGPAGFVNQQTVQGTGGTINVNVFNNQGTVIAMRSNDPVIIQCGSGAGACTNLGKMETAGGKLDFTGTLDNTNGSIVSDALIDVSGQVNGGTFNAQGGTINLNTGGVFSGNMLTGSGGGAYMGMGGTVDGMTNGKVTITAPFIGPANSNFILKGEIENDSQITVGQSSCALVQGSAILDGTGICRMGSGCLAGSSGGDMLTIDSMHTVAGSGTVGSTHMGFTHGGVPASGNLGITNKGNILADQNGALNIVPDPSLGFTNNGTLTTTGLGGLDVYAPFNNLVGTTLMGGTYAVTTTLGIQNGNIVTNAANTTLTSSSALILNLSNNQSALQNLALNAPNAMLSLQSGALVTVAKNFTNKGNMIVGKSSGFKAGGSYTQAAGSTTVDGTLTAPAGLKVKKRTLLGQGTVAAVVTSKATITVGDSLTKPGILSITGSYTEGATGILNLPIAGTTVGSQYSQLAISNGASLNGTLNIKRAKGYVPNIGDTFTILTGSAVSGKFAKVKGLSINSAEHFEITYGGTAVTLKVVSGPAEEALDAAN
jgi:hypothetical protein